MFCLLWKDFKNLHYSRKKIVILLTVLIILIIGTYSHVMKNNESEKKYKFQFGITDLDNSMYSSLLLDYFRGSDSFSSYINIVEGNLNDIERRFEQSQLDGYLIIPSGFAENLIRLKHDPVNVYINTADATKAIIIKNLLESYEKYIGAVELNCVGVYEIGLLSGMEEEIASQLNSTVSYDLIFTVLGKEQFFKYSKIDEIQSANMIEYYGFVLLILLILYGSIFVGFNLLKEKKKGVFQRLHVVGISKIQVLSEKLIFTMLTIGSPIALFTLFFLYFTKELYIIKILLFVILAFLVCMLFFMALNLVFRTESNYMIISNLLSFFWIIIGGCIIPLQYLPWDIVKLAKFTPTYWFLSFILQIQKGMEVSQYFFVCFLLLCISISFFLCNLFLSKNGGCEAY